MRYLDAVARRPVDRPPVWLMRQAGRYLPEYREIRARVDFQDAIRTPEIAAELTLQPLRRFPLDAAIVFADIMTPLEAMGVEMTFAPGPVLARRLADADELAPLDPASGVPHVLETLRLVRKELDDDVAVIGFCGAPFTLAAYLLQGGAGADFLAVRSRLLADPDGMSRLLDVLAVAMADYLAAQLEAGADAVQIFDSWVGLVSPSTYAELIAPALRTLLARLRAAAPGRPVTYFAPAAAHLLAFAGELDVDVVGVDWRLPIDTARDLVNPAKAIQGNVDPAALVAGPAAARRATADVLHRFGDRPGLIVNVGTGLVPETPVEAVVALVDTVISWHTEAG